MSSISVVTVGDTTEQLVDGLERLHGPVTVVRRCVELPELLAACQSGLASAAVVAAGNADLTATLVDRLAAVGVAVLAVADDPEEVSRLRGIGVATVPAATTPDELAARILALAVDTARASSGGYAHAPASAPHNGGPDQAGTGSGSTAAGTKTGAMSGTKSATAAEHGRAQEPASATGPRKSSKIIAVWGPAGSPGRTMVALNIAAELAAGGQTVLLVDADSYGASVAASLGLLDESASLAQACRLADQGVLTVSELERVAAQVVFAGGTLRVLTGLTRADRWPELRPAALERVFDTGRELADVVVVDCGFCLENDEELSYDTIAPRRNAATLCTAAAADTVLAVGSADSVGLPRLIRGLADLDNAGPGIEPTVILNKVRKGAAGRGPERALAQAWERFGPEHRIGHFLPWEPDITDKALLAGRLLMEIAPDSALRKSIAAIVCAPVQQTRRSAVASATAKP